MAWGSGSGPTATYLFVEIVKFKSLSSRICSRFLRGNLLMKSIFFSFNPVSKHCHTYMYPTANFITMMFSKVLYMVATSFAKVAHVLQNPKKALFFRSAQCRLTCVYPGLYSVKTTIYMKSIN